MVIVRVCLVFKKFFLSLVLLGLVGVLNEGLIYVCCFWDYMVGIICVVYIYNVMVLV